MDLRDRIDRDYAALAQAVQRPNVLLAGGTGVGKSSLVNAVFGAELAGTGVGLPFTAHIQRHEGASTPITLYDTVGYELDADLRPAAIDEIVEFAAGRTEGDASQRMHLVWYVIDLSRDRVLDLDLELIDRLQREHLPLAVVLSKADLAAADGSGIAAARQALSAVVPATQTFVVTTRPLPSLGQRDIGGLCEWSAEHLPVGLRLAFAKAQRVSLAVKRDKARWVVLQHVGANFGVGWIPIPFSDAPVLIASQSSMIARILYIYDLEGLSGSVKAAYSTLGGTMVSALGVMTAANILKFFPGIGTAVAGLITGSVAAAITQALGSAVIAVCSHAYNLALDGRVEELEAYLQDTSRALQEAFENAEQSRDHGMQVLPTPPEGEPR